MKPTAATINQEVKDFKETYSTDIKEIKSSLHEILEQAKKTNGRVTTLEANEKICPAKNAYVNGVQRDNTWKTLNIIIAGTSVLITFTALLITFLK